MVGVVEMVKEGTLTKEVKVDNKETPIVVSTVLLCVFELLKDKITKGVTRLRVPMWLYRYKWSEHVCS